MNGYMKDLPFPEKKIVPFVDAYLSHMLQEKEIYSYAIAENFIRCFIDQNLESTWIDYYNAYRYESYYVFRGFDLSSDAIKFSSRTMSDIIDQYLDNGYSVIYSVDVFYLNAYERYNKEHRIHPLLIYKMDNEKKEYVCRDYFDFMVYTNKVIKKEEINNSFHAVYGENEKYYCPLLQIFKLNGNNENTGEENKNRKLNAINLEKILLLLREFINGSNFFEQDISYKLSGITKYSTGINIFDGISDHIFYELEHNDYVNIKLFKFVEHHIYMMWERMEILLNTYHIKLEEGLLECILSLLRYAEVTSNIAFKYNVSKNKNKQNIYGLCNRIFYMKSQYRQIILKLIRDIEKELSNENKMLSIGVERLELESL